MKPALRNPDNILEVEGLVTRFRTETGTLTAVKGISFELKKGETLAIVGESGSGKSVTALSIINLIPNPPGEIAEGRIDFQSPATGWIDLARLRTDSLRRYRGKEISMIFQEPMTSLNPVFTCGFQVMKAILLHEKCDKATAKAKTIDLFNQVKLPRPEAIFDAYPHEISGGQKQRVMIAMAISCNPSILIADEPTTALDVTVQKTILELLQELQQRNGMAILFITHDLGVVSEIADRVLVMYKGNIVESGTVEDIFRKPQHPYTKGLLACRPRMDVRMKHLPVIADFMRESADGQFEEIEGSVEKIVASAVVSASEFDARQKTLQAQAPILEVRNLKTYFPQRRGFLGGVKTYVHAVDDVSFAVYPGETLGLVGESGCGKTTLGRSILRLVEPTSGEVFFEGKSITGMSQSELRLIRKDLQIIFQDPYSSLNPRITIGNAILEPMRVHGLHGNEKGRIEKTQELLQKVNLLPEHFGRYPHEFSGGQRQRACIARALAVEPKFIVCDESVSALDVSVQAQVLNLLVGLREEFGFTYIFISHDLSVVKFMSDRMVVMNKGKIEEIGLADDIYAHPQQEYTRKLIQAIPKGDLASIERATAARKASKSLSGQ
ncbi:MAG: ABC transporter ATP-binding protein [Bacteroidetes bacterium]|nr:ABC transporter ATP-binding protein [Bacteroidota bacterium]